MSQLSTLVGLLWNVSQTHPLRPLLHYKNEGVYRSLTSKEVWNRTQSFAQSLAGLGVIKGDRVAILSNNCPEWVIADMAVLSLGAVVVPIYPTLSDSEMTYMFNDSGCKVVVAQTASHIQSIEKLRSNCPSIEHCIGIDDGRFLALSGKDGSDVEWQSVKGKDLASIVYTSGTTGVPKGVMLSHENFLVNVEDATSVLPLTDRDVVLSFLPLSHVFERMAGYYTILFVKGQIYYAQSIHTVSDDMKEACPTVVISVPRLYEKMRVKILESLTGFRQQIFFWALGIGQSTGTSSSFKYKLADRLVFSSIRKKMGGRLRFFVSGGAPLGKELGEFFNGLGIMIVEGYGQTETSPVIACNRPGNIRFGSVGLPLPHMKCDITADGELRVKGDNVMMGYWKKPTATAEVLDDEGWLYTGDIARIDSEGFLFIVDRKKELIVLSNGKKVPPQYVEKLIGMSPAISQVIVIGEQRNYISALIVPNVDALKKVATLKNIGRLNLEKLVYHPDIISYYQHEIDTLQEPLSGYEKVKKFILLSQEFSQDAGEITVTLKLKRKFINQKYATQIESMYH